MFFFFKQKTAYEMRISDWSSDVCSSDLSPEAAPPLLCNIETRLDLLRQTGLVDYCCVLPFDEQRQRETVDDFVINNLVRRLGMRILVVGENFACGRGRKGDLAYLSALGEQFGFTVQPQPLHAPHGAPRCSSTETRRLTHPGQLTEAPPLPPRTPA